MANFDLKSLRKSLELVERWRRRHAGIYTDGLNISQVVMKGPAREFDVDHLRELVQHGHRVAVTVRSAGFEARVGINPPGAFDAEILSGEPENAFSGEELRGIQAAYDQKRGEDFLRTCGDLECLAEVTLLINPQAYGFNWIRTASALTNPGGQGSWWDTIQGLFRAPAVPRLVVEDAGADWLIAGGIAIGGPEAEAHAASGYEAGPWEAYRKTWVTDDRRTLPAPVAIYPFEHQGLNTVGDFLARAAHALCWVWLATSGTVSAARFVIIFEAGAYLEKDFTEPPPQAGVENAIALSEWSTASPDYMRRDAVEQAISMAVSSPATLIESARRVLNTAKRLLQLAQSGAVAEVLASRRAAIQAAVDAARTSSEAARGAARSSSDRVFAEVAAGAGIVLTNNGSLIGAVVAHWLIIVVAALAAVTGVSAYLFEYPAAGHTLDSYEKDLDTRRDALTEDDVRQIKAMESLKQARSDIRGAMINTGILLAGAFILLVIGWNVVK
jgi:hypothetical protein